MNPDSINLESLVAEVVRRLQRLADAPQPTGAAAAEEQGAGVPGREAAEGDLLIDTRLVTLATIQHRLAGVRRLLVRAGAVVTPSVKDELRKRRIRLEYLSEPAPTRDAADALAIACCTHTPEAARAAAALAHPAGASCMRLDDLRCAAQTLATIVADANRLGVLVTDQPLPAVCLANRAPAARAAWVENVSQLRDAVAAIGLNVLVVHPVLCTPETWNALLTEYRQGLPRRCPPGLLAAPGSCGG